MSVRRPGHGFRQYILELLSPLGAVAAKRFFGGTGFSLDGVQFAMVMRDTLYLRVDAETRPRYERAGAAPFSYATRKGQVEVRTYFAVPEALLDDAEELCIWAGQAIRAATRSSDTGRAKAVARPRTGKPRPARRTGKT